MELLELLYIALGTIGILFGLHLITFWVARLIQPQKPKIVYVQAPQQQQQQQVHAPPQVQAAPQPVHVPAVSPPILSQQVQSIQLPTYDVPPPSIMPQNTSTSQPVGSLPPPIETRSTTKQSGGDLGAPR
jgi:hypothetical protein